MSTGHSLLRSTFAHTFDPDTSHVGIMFVHPWLRFSCLGLLILNNFGVLKHTVGYSILMAIFETICFMDLSAEIQYLWSKVRMSEIPLLLSRMGEVDKYEPIVSG